MDKTVMKYMPGGRSLALRILILIKKAIINKNRHKRANVNTDTCSLFLYTHFKYVWTKKTNACTKIKIELIIKGRRSNGCTKGGRKTA